MAYCGNCGSPRIEGAKFCGSCGQALPESTSPPAPRMVATAFPTQLDVVAQFFLELGSENEDLVAAYDLGFPLAVAFMQGGVEDDGLTETGRGWISETFLAILDSYGLDPSREFESLDEILEVADYES